MTEKINYKFYIYDGKLPIHPNLSDIASNYSELDSETGEMEYLLGKYEEAYDKASSVSMFDEVFFSAQLIAVNSAIAMGSIEKFDDTVKRVKNWSEVASEKLSHRENRNLIKKAKMVFDIFVGCSLANIDGLPEWFKEGNLEFVPLELRKVVMLSYMKYLTLCNDVEPILMAERARLCMLPDENTIFVKDIYYKLEGAIALFEKGKIEEARKWIKDALDAGLPIGIVTPFSELAFALHGQVEEVLYKFYKDMASSMDELWHKIGDNWGKIHGYVTKKDMSINLTTQEYHVAKLIVQGKSYKEVAKAMELSTGRINNIVSEIYGKLGVHKKEELSKYII